MSDIVISINGKTLERFAYWIIIIVLAVLLTMSYLDKPTSQEGTQETTQQEETTEGIGELVEEVIEPIVEEPAIDETCSDGIKNQDETNTDCGGICTEIRGAYWYESSCHKEEEQDLSGEVTLELVTVSEEKSPTSDFYKVQEIKVAVENGESSKLVDPYIIVYVKSTGGVYLNQFGDSDDGYTAYATIDSLGSVSSGDTITRTLDVGGAYIFSQTGYGAGDDFKVTVELYDEDDDKIASATKTVKI